MRNVPPVPRFSWAARIAAAQTDVIRRRRLCAILAFGACAALALPLASKPAPRLIWNTSASSPTGLYFVTPGQDAVRGDTVIARLPESARFLADQRHYVPAAVPVVKRIVAAGGDLVCTRGSELFVNNAVIARRLERDSQARPLPRWYGCCALRSDEILLIGDRRDSFDGRYFGPVARTSLIGTAKLLWAR